MQLSKYIIVEKHGLETAIILHPSISHNEAMNPDQLAVQDSELLSAGYFRLLPDGSVEVAASMPSTTLDLAPRSRDAEVIEQTLHLLGLRTLAVA